jgi:nucleoside-diphosphate-sugar epimerase
MNFGNSVIAVTGAGGFLGSACCRRFSERGATVRALLRRPEAHPELLANARGGMYSFDLAGDFDPRALDPPVRAVIHCACVMNGASPDATEAANFNGTTRLFDWCQRVGAGQIVFISSMAAHAEARSSYGRSKWRLEAEARARSACIIKPGTILGSGGLFAHVRSVVQKLPVIPLFYSSRRLQTVYIDDLVDAIEQVIALGLNGPYSIADPDGVAMPAFYRAVAALEGKRARLAPFPGNLALLGLQAAEAVRFRLPITSDNLLGLKYLRHFDVLDSLQTVGVRVRGFWSAMIQLAESENNPRAAAAIAAMRQSLR